MHKQNQGKCGLVYHDHNSREIFIAVITRGEQYGSHEVITPDPGIWRVICPVLSC
jgi:hypothetical protein